MLSPQQQVSATHQQHIAATQQQQPATQHQGDTTPSAETDTASQRDNYLPTTPAGHSNLLRSDESNLLHCAEPKPLLFDRMHEFTVVKVEDDEQFI